MQASLLGMRLDGRGCVWHSRPPFSRWQRDMNQDIDGFAAWMRLAAALLIGTLGGVGMWSVVVVLPAVQAEFAVDRGAASLPYSLTMIGYAVGSVFMGRWTDRVGVFRPVVAGALALGLGYVAAGFARNLIEFALAQAVLIAAIGSSPLFGPLMADVSWWFRRYRGFALSVCATGNYFAGTLWPPVINYFMQAHGWRATQIGMGIFLMIVMLPLAFLFRRPAPAQDAPIVTTVVTSAPQRDLTRPFGLSPNMAQVLIAFAGVACCVAMSMPQVHIVAYCSDLGYGVARGAEMLSLMMGFGIVSRLASGYISDKIGGLNTLLIGSFLQGVALALYVIFDGLNSLYVVSALFGLFQGGIVPSYAMIVREYFPAKEAGTRVSIALTATMLGMALGGWLNGVIFDWKNSYDMAFLNGLAWNFLNLSITVFLIMRARAIIARATPVRA